ncbi:MAG: GntR family transcriptional regulator, partial [Anderseniella sp.]|nr:GntR family transcriptional regulator [Anderseniella sp.]
MEDATETLRNKLLAGGFPPGKKLGEVAVAEEIGVSRTLARLAMSALEHEGLLIREPNRGSRVKRFTVTEIVDAIEVR